MKTVLIIDDDQACREPVAELLRGDGWTVHEAENGQTGLDAARRLKPDAIVCDLLMPVTNGFQLCHAVRQEKSLKHVKILVLTGRDYPTDRKIAEELGADDYLVKPMEIRHLVDALERLVGIEDSGDAIVGGHKMGGEDLPPRIKFWGVRGSTPTPGPDTIQYGGNTSCVEVRADGELIIFDAGSGIRPLGNSLAQEFDDHPIDANLLLTHTHWDHIQGFPFFGPAYNPNNLIRIFGMEGARKGLRETLEDQMQSPYFPISMAQMAANIIIEEVKEMRFKIGPLTVEACYVNHPDVCVGYKVITSHGSICYIPDHESAPEGFAIAGSHVPSTIQKRVIEFAQNAEVLIMDAQYTYEEYRTHVGWGHGCLDEVVRVAKEAKVTRLYLFHHDPGHDDEFIANMLVRAQELAEGSGLIVEAAREGEMITLPAKV